LALEAQGQKSGAEVIPAEAISVQVVDLMRMQYKTRFEDLFPIVAVEQVPSKSVKRPGGGELERVPRATRKATSELVARFNDEKTRV
jgi:hypothetical protein